MSTPHIIAAPIQDVANGGLERVMSPAQLHALSDLRTEHPELSYTPTLVHGLSGMLEVSVCRGTRELRVIGLACGGGEVPYAIVSRA